MHVDAAEMETRLHELRLRREQQRRARLARRLALAALAAVAVLFVVAAFAYAGSPDRLAEGTRIAGLDVGGLSATQAVSVLEGRGAKQAAVPLTVRAPGVTLHVRPAALGLQVDWPAAVDEAQGRGDGFLPLRGVRRLSIRLFGTDVSPPAKLDDAAVARLVARAARNDAPHRDAAIRLAGLRPVVVDGRAGRVLDREASTEVLAGALTSLEGGPVTLPSRTDEPAVTAEMLQPALEQVRTALSGPVRLRLGDDTTYRVSQRRLAAILDLPSGGETGLAVRGRGADRYFRALSRMVNTQARDAEFVVVGGHVLIKPSVNARVLDVPRTAERLLAAALRPRRRVASMAVATQAPARTTADAKRMGITGVVSSYTTIYGGDANRIHNVRLVAELIDDTLIAPGHAFSFNATTGDRNEAKGFLSAPVIINGEVQTGLGGGVCQVSTTVFNAAYEAGLNITARTNHALYISHYPQGRDATVNYPDTDLRFVNDTGRWLLLRTFVGSSSLTVNLYGTPVDRRVETQVAPLRVTGPAPVERQKDPSLPKGEKVVVEAGSPSLATSVRRRVYKADGSLLYDTVWYSSYRGEKRIVRIGTKPKPKAAKTAKVPTTEPTATAPRTGGGN